MKIDITTPDFINYIPTTYGVYRFYDNKNTLLYVGKAINLKNRVKQYFQSNSKISHRISIMVAKIHMIELTLTENESSALVLENNLIKELKPKYNIMFRDDKTYPLIRITNHKFPKIDYYRSKTLNKHIYFGPFPNAHATKHTIDTIQKIFRIRTCSDNFFNTRNRPCMLYQIQRCSAPCTNKISAEEYNEQIALVKKFLNGEINQLIDSLSKKMNDLATLMKFEEASVIRDEIFLLNQTHNTQIITTHNTPLNGDIIHYTYEDSKLYIYLIIVRCRGVI